MEIKKIMNENMIEDIFDVSEEHCWDDCIERKFFNWATGQWDYSRSAKGTTLF